MWKEHDDWLVVDLWLLEGGQSATGSLVDFIVKGHSAYPSLQEISKKVTIDHLQQCSVVDMKSRSPCRLITFYIYVYNDLPSPKNVHWIF